MNNYNENYAREIFFNRMMYFINEIKTGMVKDGVQNPAAEQQLLTQAHNVIQAQTMADTNYKFQLNNIYALTRNSDPVTLGNTMANNIKDLGYLPDSMKRVAERQAVSFTEELNSFMSGLQSRGLTNTSSSVVKANSMLANTDTFVRHDLYQSVEDIGIIGRRIHDQNFYHDNVFAQVNEAIFQYTQGADAVDKQGRKVGFSDLERSYRDYLMTQSITAQEMDRWGVIGYTDDKINKILANIDHDPASFRIFAHDLQQGVNQYTRLIKGDRQQLNGVRQILKDAEAQKKPLVEVIEKSYANTKIGQEILKKVRASGNKTDDYVRGMMRNFMMMKGNMEVPVVLASSVTDQTQRMVDAIGGAMKEMNNPKNPDYALYQKYRGIKSEHTKFMNELYTIRKEANVEGSLYINNQESLSHRASSMNMNEDTNVAYKKETLPDVRGEDRPRLNGDKRDTLPSQSNEYVSRTYDTKMGSVIHIDEANNTYYESNRLAMILDANDEAERKHRRAIEEQLAEGRERPQQPMNRFRNIFAQYFVETGSEEAKRLAGKAEADLSVVFNKDKYDPSMRNVISEATFNDIKERIANKEVSYENFSITRYQAKDRNQRSVDKWESALENNESIRMKGSEVGHRIVPNKDGRAVSSDGYVTLEREHELVENARIKMDVEKENIQDLLDQMDDRRRRAKVTEEASRKVVEEIQDDAFINIRYKQEAVSEDLKNRSEFLYERLSNTDKYLQDNNLTKYGIKEANVRAIDIANEFNVYRKNLTELDPEGIEHRKSLPKFLLRMAESHAPWMMDDTSELVSHSEVALREVLNRMANGQQTIDLTDEGLLKEFDVYAERDAMGQLTQRAEKQRNQFIENLAGRNISQRLEDNLFLKVLGEMVQQNFQDKGTNGGVESLIRAAADMAEQNDRRGIAHDIHSMIKSPTMEFLFKEHGYYAQARSLTPDQIGRIIREREMTEASMVSFERLIQNDVDFSTADEIWSQRGINPMEGQEVRVGGDAYIKQAYDEVYDTRIANAYGNPEQSVVTKLGSLTDTDYKGGRVTDEAEIMERSKAQLLRVKEEELTMEYKANKMNTFIEDLKTKGVSFNHIDDINTMLDLAKEQGMEHIEATVRDQPAYIYQGEKGDVIAHLLRDDRRIQLVNSSAGLQDSVHVDDKYPTKLYGGAQIQYDYGDGGVPVRHQYTSYDTIQGSGKFARSSNPSVTVEGFQRFLRGTDKMTYLDIETTGLSGSTLPEEVIQPLEVHMQKVQWDRRNGRLLQNEDGEFVIRHAGRETVREQQLILGLKPETKAFMEEVVANEDFRFTVGDRSYDLIDYEHHKGRINDLINKSENAVDIRRQIVEKQDKLWFLRNIAKYAFPDTEDHGEIMRYQQYAGNMELPKSGSEFLTVLREDVQKAADNLASAGTSGGVKFSPVQVGTTEEGMIKHVSRFVGKGMLAGQNVADADWSKFVNISNKLVHDATMPFKTAQKALMDGITDVANTHVLDTLRDIQLAANLSDVKGFDKATKAYIEPAIKQMMKEDVGYKSLSSVFDDIRKANNEGMGHERFTAMLDSLQAGKDVEGFDSKLTMNLHRRIEDFAHIDELYQSASEGSSMPKWARKGKLNHFNDDATKEMLTGIDKLVKDVNVTGDELRRVQKIQADLPRPKIVEQMYLYNMVNPNAVGRKAEDQFAAMNIKVDDSTGLHLARADVRNNLKLIERYGQELGYDPDFMFFDTTPLQKGDVVDLHTSFDDRIARGVYSVDSIDKAKHTMTFGRTLEDGTEEMHTIYGKSSADLSRKVNNHFAFIGTGGDAGATELALDRFTQDNARRQVNRAMRHADVFDKYNNEIDELVENNKLTHDPLRKMQSVYEEAQGKVNPEYGPVMHPKDLSLAEQVALHKDNVNFFEGTAVQEALDETASNTKRLAFDKTEDWMLSPEGRQRYSFLDEVRSMEAAGALDPKMSNTLVKQWNDAIKEEGLRRGAKHSVFNRANLGTLDNRFGYMNGRQFVLDTSDPSRISNGLWRMAEGLKGLTNEPDEVKAKAKALNSLVLPFLQEQGFIKEFDQASPPGMVSVVNQLMKNKHNLPAYEDYDPIVSAEMSKSDMGYQKFLRDKHDEILEPHRQSLTTLQRSKQQVYQSQLSELREQGLYDPRLTVEPRISGFDLDTMRFGRNGSVTTMQADELGRLLQVIDPRTSADAVDARNTIAGELFNRAIGDGRFNIQDVIDAGESDRLAAMRALNWVTPDNQVNTNVATHLVGEPGIHASEPLGMQSVQMLDKIAEQDVGKYTRDNGYSSYQDKIRNWKGYEDTDGKWVGAYDTDGNRLSYPGRFPEAPDNESRRVSTFDPKEASRASNEQIKADGQGRRTQTPTPGEGGQNALRYYRTENLDPNTNYQHSNAISEALHSAKEKATNLASEMWHGTPGKAMKWMAGIGAAAFAVNQFMNAASPVQLQRKPMGHGVEGATGQANDGLNQQQNQPATGGKTYVNSGESQPPTGYEVNVKGTAKGDVDYNAMQEKVNQTIGNFNANISDDRSTFNRSWLEKQFGDYIDRGYVGQE